MMNKIICGNAVAELGKLGDNSVDIVITSPPYFDQRNYSEEDDPLEIGHEESIFFYISRLKDVFYQCTRVCKPTGSIVFNVGDKYIDGSLQLIPYQFSLAVLKAFPVKLINDITWVKTNPTPHQYKRRLINSTEPFFHFVKTNDYYYNRDAFLDEDKETEKKLVPMKESKSFYQKGGKYIKMIKDSLDLSNQEKINAHTAIEEVLMELRRGEITDFRMKIRGIHAKAFGGQAGGRNSQMEKQGFTIIKMYGCKLKRDVIINSVANTKDVDHPAVFPLKVITEVIKLLSRENDVILDPFCGSGQVCVASKLLNRRYLGIDLKKEYCELAESRISKVEGLI